MDPSVAAAHGIRLVDAPVSGSTHPAENGELTILASGPDTARTMVQPVFDALASRVLWVGKAGMGSRLKMAANHWMITMVGALAESANHHPDMQVGWRKVTLRLSTHSAHALTAKDFDLARKVDALVD